MAAVAVNAASAVLETEDKKMDLVGAVVVGLATSLGGGSLRDLLLNRPVFWLADVAYLVCGLLAVGLTFVVARRVRVRPASSWCRTRWASRCSPWSAASIAARRRRALAGRLAARR
jgi:uncharacterized membrane protein YeiH